MRKRIAYFAMTVPLLLLFMLLFLGSLAPVLTKTVAEAELSLPASKAWEKMMDFTSYPKWRRDIASVDKIYSTGSNLAWKETFKDQSEAQWELIDAKPGDYIVLNRVLKNRSENERWTFTFRAVEEKTYMKVEVRESVVSPIKRAVILIRNQIHSPASEFLKSLASW